MLHGEQRGLFDLSFAIPAECADRLQSGLADIGIVPAVELNRQKLEIIRGAGIACHGPVRSIFLISKVPYRRNPQAGGRFHFANLGGAQPCDSGAQVWRRARSSIACAAPAVHVGALPTPR